jgi:hypothetical protein
MKGRGGGGGRGRVAETCNRQDKNMRFRMSSQRSRACALEPGDACLCKKRGETIENADEAVDHGDFQLIGSFGG